MRTMRTMLWRADTLIQSSPCGCAAGLVATLEETAADVDPCIAGLCSNLAGIHAALRRLRAVPHTMDDLRRYQQVLGGHLQTSRQRWSYSQRQCYGPPVVMLTCLRPPLQP